ncbi:hypothetical protein J7F03_38055 [Streptomyces sp. ISL-43]|uniref:hypothetical protein n=1 Tax=Streptomyces sp. ISL-43 TaxID=2819183 RepID=UPI001BEA1356|nr:hypothetical protein [Streptomyces sp. ISL-43]MBT2452745.1 hypothetical protein [Streptomyces sp. ISL-43]
MSRQRLRLALKTIDAGDWRIFEEFAADFLAVEYPSLRTMAAPQGDKGRDGQLFIPAEQPTDMVQYSVAQDWKSKINRTLKRLSENFTDIRRLIYATNREIGPAADELVSQILKDEGVVVDIRDSSWFLERRETHPQRASASEELCRSIVDPLLRAERISSQVGLALNAQDARLGLLHLSLQNQDEATEKGLTRESFESLTLSALHDTTPENLLSRREVHSRVTSFLPAGHEQQVDALVDGALLRLSGKKGMVKHHRNGDVFCLAHDERKRLGERTAEFVQSEQLLEEQLVENVIFYGGSIADDKRAVIGAELWASLEWFLLKRGEAFAEAVRTGEMSHVDKEGVEQLLRDETVSKSHKLPAHVVADSLVHVLDRPAEEVKAHLRRLADGYTLFSFLRQTPDVQKVVVSLFSEGDFWIDTSVILPIIAETLIEDSSQRHYTTIFKAAVDAGIRLFVTDGIIEEVERHLNRCLQFSRIELKQWNGSVPFLYAAYTLSGRARSGFIEWMENFRGNVRPVEDVQIYLEDELFVRRKNLVGEAESAPIELRAAVQEVWSEAHERRRKQRESEWDPTVTQRLVAHDVETTVGIIELRSHSESSPMGHKYWLVTLDKVAFRLKRELADRLHEAPSSPVLSPDFLSQFLRLGPLRTAIEREQRINMPLLVDVSKYDYLPKSLVELADNLREKMNGKNERLIRRGIRDSLDKMRTEEGVEAAGGLKAAEERIMTLLQQES